MSNRSRPHIQSLSAPASANPQRYSLFGLTLESDFPFTTHFLASKKSPDLRFSCQSEAPAPQFWEDAECIYRTKTSARQTTGELSGSIHENGRCTVLRFGAAADYYLWDDQIICHLRDDNYRHGIEVWLLGLVISYWLEQRGLIVLHASAVSNDDDHTVAFLSSSQGGKSSLAAAFLDTGWSLVTDDILPVEAKSDAIIARPSYPQMRMWPDSVRRHAGDPETFERVVPHLSKRRVPVGAHTFGTFCEHAQPLSCIYIPDMQSGGHRSIDISSIDHREALQELLLNSFVTRATDITPRQGDRLQGLTNIIRQTPVRRVVYTRSPADLDRVCRAIMSDLTDRLRVGS